MKKFKKWPIRVISLLLIAVMFFSSVPVTSFASETQTTNITAETTDIPSDQPGSEENDSSIIVDAEEAPVIQETESSAPTEESNPSEEPENAQNIENAQESSENDGSIDESTLTSEDGNENSNSEPGESSVSDGSLPESDNTDETEETVSISVSLSQETVQENLVGLNIDNAPSSGFFSLGETIHFSLTLSDEQASIHEVSASLNGSPVEVQDNGDGSYSIYLPTSEDYSGDPDGMVEITVDAELPSTDDTTAHITWSVTPEETAILNLSPEKESYEPGDLVTLSLDLIEGYDLSEIQAFFGDDSLELDNADPEGHSAVYTLQIPNFTADTKQDIHIEVTTQPSFPGYMLETSTEYASISFEQETAVPGELLTATITADEGYVLPESSFTLIAQKDEQNLQEIDLQDLNLSEDMKTATATFTVPDLGADETITLVLSAKAVKQYYISQITLESDDSSEEVSGDIAIAPDILYEGITVTVSGFPDSYNQVYAYPYGSTDPVIQLTSVDDGYSFVMPGYDVEIIAEESDEPLIMDPEDVYTPNTDFTFGDKSDIPNEPSMEVQKQASWTNIQAGEALLTIAEKDLNQYTNLPCDYIILVDCSATMETVDPGTSKSRYELANEAISQLLDRIQADNATLSDDLKSQVAFMTYSGSGDNGRHPTHAQYESDYFAATDALNTGDYDYFLSGVYEYSGFTTDMNAIKGLLNSNIRKGSKINLALDKTIELLQAKGDSKRMTKVINISDCGNGWYGPMREGYFTGNMITDWLGVHNDSGVTANDKVEAIKNTYGAYFMQICIGPVSDQRDVDRTSVSEATGDHLFWTYDGTESRFNEIFTQIHDIPYEITATGKQVIDLIDTTYWDIVGIESCSTGMNTVSLSGNRLTWNIPDGTAEQVQTCTIRLKLKDQYRYMATSDTTYRTNADGSTPGCTYRYTITGGIYDGESRNGSTKTPTLKYGTVEFSGSKTWTVTGSQASSITTTLRQTLPGREESAIDTRSMSDPNWTYSYTNADRLREGKYPYIKFNNTGQEVSYRVTESVPSWYTNLPGKTSGSSTIKTDLYNEPYKIKARIEKVDEDTGNLLSGSTFEVYQWSLSANKYIPYKGITSGTISGTDYESGNINGSNDIMKLSEVSKGIYETPSWLYYTPDNAGRFAIVEAQAPEGYFGDWENDSLVTSSSSDEDKIFHEISINASGLNNGQTLIVSNQDNSKFGNQRVLGQISFSKKDLESGLSAAQGDASLENATYKLYAAKDIIHADGSTGILYRAGESIPLHLAGSGNDINVYTYDPSESNTTIVIPEGGNIVIRGLELGEYYIQEVSASEGYLVDPNQYHVQLAYKGENTDTVRVESDGVYEQVKKQKLTFYKVTDEGSSEVVPMPGAKFSVYLVSDLEDEKYVNYTDADLEQAIIDFYRDSETLQYEGMKQFRPATVYDESTSEDVVSGKLVKKLRYSTGESYQISENNGYLVGEIESDKNGIVTLPSLPYGRYVVVETTTPKDKIATRPFVFSVTADDEHGMVNSDQDTDGTRLDDMVFLVDRPISSLIRIEKTDSNSGNVVLKPGAAYIIHDINSTWFDYIMDGKTTAEKEAYKDQFGDLVVQYSQGEYVGTQENPFTTKVVSSAENINKSTYIDTIEALPAGTYELEELEAPSGYVLQGHEGVIQKNRALDPNYTFYETEEDGAWTATPQGRIRFTVSSEYAVYDASVGDFITEVRQNNDPVIGKISVYAEGEQLVDAHQDGTTIADRLADKLSGFFNSIKGLFGLDTETEEGLTEAELSEYQNYTFDYEIGPVEGSEFVLYAAEDIYSQEYDEQALERLEAAGTPVEPLFKAGEAVLTLTTDENGQAWTGSEDWPGTDEAKGLPLGKYYLVQTVAGEGFVLTDENKQPREINIEYAGQTVPVVYRDAAYDLPRQKVSIQAVKKDQETGEELSGAIFGLYAAENITAESGKVVIKSGTLVAIAETTVNADGSVKPAIFEADLPLANYYVKEIRAPFGYSTTLDRFDIDATYHLSNQEQSTISASWNCENAITQIQINLMDYYTEVELDEAQLTVIDSEGNAFTTILTEHNNNPVIKGLQPGETYTLKELVARDGYHYDLLIKEDYRPGSGIECDKEFVSGASDTIKFTVQDTGELQTVSVFNKPILGDLTIQKTGPVSTNPQLSKVSVREIQDDGSIQTVIKDKADWDYEQAGLPGAEYAIRAAEDIEYPDGYTGIIFEKGDLILDTYANLHNSGILSSLEIGIKDGLGSQIDVSDYIGIIPSDMDEDSLKAFYSENGSQVERQFPSEDEISSDQKKYNGTAVSYTLLTGDDGKVSVTGLPLGSYELAEVKAPEGYHRSMKDAVQQIDLVPNETSGKAETASISVNYTNDRQQPGLDPVTGQTEMFITKYGLDGDNKSGVSGAEFTLYAAEDITNIFGDVIIPAGAIAGQAISGSDGNAYFSAALPVGHYIAKESVAPAGYYMSSKTIDFNLSPWKYADEVHYLAADDYVEDPISSVHITLIDDLTGNTLENGSFQIKDEDGNIVDAWITGENGDYTIKGLEFDKTYEIIETLPREGYLNSITNVHFNSDNGQLLEADESSIKFILKETTVIPDDDGNIDPESIPGTTEIILSNPFVVGEVEISKNGEVLDSWTLIDKAISLIKSIFSYDNAPLSGVEFTVYAAQDIIHPDGKTGVVFRSGDIVATGVRSTNTDAVKTTDQFGTVKFEEMYLGEYIIRETRVPDGYVSGSDHPIAFIYNGNVSPVGATTGDIEWTNERQHVSVEIIKHDSDDPDRLLQGAVFGLYNADEILNSNGSTLVSPDTLLETAKSGNDGTATFESDLPLGSYYVKELEAPLGYTSNPEILEIDASYDPSKDSIRIQKDVYNEATKIYVEKTAQDTAEPLPGCTLAVMDGNNIIDTWETDGKSHLITGLLVDHEYTLKEIAPADGYTIANDIAFTVQDRDPDTGIYSGQHIQMSDNITSVTIYKTDANTGTPVAGCVVGIYSSDGQLITSAETGSDGSAVFTKLAVGDYIYKELAAPETYALDPNDHPFTIHPDGRVTGTTTFSDDYVRIQIHKVNSKNEPLAGAEFTIYDSTGQPVKTCITDENGNLEFVQLPIGTYTVIETKAPSGYKLSEEEIKVDVTPTWVNGSVYTIENARKSSSHSHSGSDPEETGQAQAAAASTAAPVSVALTGDSTHIAVFVLLAIFAAIILVILWMRKNKHK